MESNRQAEVMDGRQGVQVIARAAQMLRCLRANTNGLTVGELSHDLALPRSTVQRIARALADEQLVALAPDGQVRLGHALESLGEAARNAFREAARPILKSISQEVAETVDLSVLQNGDAVFIEQTVANQRLQTISAVGERFPLHCTANGKAILSILPEASLEAQLAQPLAAMTPSTLTDADALRRHLAGVRETQVAWDIEEHSVGVCAIGTAFKNTLGRFYALSIPVPAARFQAKKDSLRAPLMRGRAAMLDLIAQAEGTVLCDQNQT